jgi:hypothetical protein
MMGTQLLWWYVSFWIVHSSCALCQPEKCAWTLHTIKFSPEHVKDRVPPLSEHLRLGLEGMEGTALSDKDTMYPACI